MAKRVGTFLLLAYVLIATASRSLRLPNDFAEAHWLLDYRDGPLRRGLPGELLAQLANAFLLPISEQLLATLSGAILILLSLTLVLVALRTIAKSQWSAVSVLVAITFLSSSFVVMTVHLNGYFDHLLLLLGMASIVAVLRGHPWLGAVLQSVAALTHEASLLLVFPCFLLTWSLVNKKRRESGAQRLAASPLMVPILTLLALLLAQHLWLAPDFETRLSARLAETGFVGDARAVLVPSWLALTLPEVVRIQLPNLAWRLGDIATSGLFLPTVIASLVFTLSTHRVRGFSTQAAALLAVTFATQGLHLVAWDTTRIGSFVLVNAFLVGWICSETLVRDEAHRLVAPLSLATLVSNVLILTPLFDGRQDNLDLTVRLLLFAPVVVAGLVLWRLECHARPKLCSKRSAAAAN